MTELRGRLLLDGALVEGRVTIANGRIAAIEREPASAEDSPIVAPGLIDLHVHGFGGFDPLESLPQMARALAAHGTTAFQPTLFPTEPVALGAQCERLDRIAAPLAAAAHHARVLGAHLEGPFVNPDRAGALPRGDLAEPSLESLRAILGPSSGSGRGVRRMTLACELHGARDLIAELRRCGVRVSLGHSSATAHEARAAAAAGAIGATHLFNAMGPMHHREIGLAGFALSSDALFSEIIGDLVHVGADAFELALKARGPRGLCLVSDALRGAGTGCEAFESHGRAHVVRDGAAYYPSAAAGEPRLAGSALSQLEMARRLVARGVVTAAEALTMASETPARAAGVERELGVLAVGARADLVVLASPDLRLERVLVGGLDVPNAHR